MISFNLPLVVLGLAALSPVHALPATPTAQDPPTRVVRRQADASLDELIPRFPQSIRDAIANGIVPSFFRNIPSDPAALVRILAGADAEQTLEVLNIPGYANYTNNAWNLRVRGQAFTRPYNTLSRDRQNELADIFVPDVDVANLPEDQADNARNLTSYVLLLPAPEQDIQMRFEGGQGWSDERTIGRSDSRGEFDTWAALQGDGLPDGGGSGGPVGTVDYWALRTQTGNATGYLVPDEGITIVSDVDDILRVTEIYNPQEALLNTFVRDFEPWMNMPDVYNGWAQSSNGNGSRYHFHYLTTTPIQATSVYMSFIYSVYPPGSFDTRPLNFSNIQSVTSPREFFLRRIFETFPNRRFVLVGDTTNGDIVKDYPLMAQEFPNQVACILVRDVSATERGNIIPYNTEHFRPLRPEQYMFFRTPDDIARLNFENGDCRNESVPQDVTFGWQGGPGGTWQDWLRLGEEEGAGGRKTVGWALGMVPVVMGLIAVGL